MGPGPTETGGGCRWWGGGHGPPSTTSTGGPCCQGPAGRDGGLGPVPATGETRRAWALNIMTGLGLHKVANPAALVPSAPAHSAPAHSAPAPPAPAPPTAASRSSGMTLQQWAAVEASSGGGTGQAH